MQISIVAIEQVPET